MELWGCKYAKFLGVNYKRVDAEVEALRLKVEKGSQRGAAGAVLDRGGRYP